MFGGSDSLGEGQKGGKQGAGDEGPLLNVKVNAVEEVTLTVVLVVREGAAPLKEEGGGVALLEEALLVGAARGGVAGVKWRDVGVDDALDLGGEGGGCGTGSGRRPGGARREHGRRACHPGSWRGCQHRCHGSSWRRREIQRGPAPHHTRRRG